MNTAMNDYPAAAEQNTEAKESAHHDQIGHLLSNVAAQYLTTEGLRRNRREPKGSKK
jgi:hypothetical protein